MRPCTALFNPEVFMMRDILTRPGHLRVGSMTVLSNNLAIEYKLISQLRKTMEDACTGGQTLKDPGGEQITLQLTELLL
ncbi:MULTISPECIES: hypothetical protein [unclassified Marinobacter]|uniref:hypothetical protein n=1 Tax=unclassified Marinobacter TaxID=83889 RepID=UPI00200F271D|nr:MULTISPECIES: hypothetical protein [unclassified Marinobacter]MCL1476628.1 hypothetical protein [Marinobacter sp.]MCL1481185.1 hypothetical protein [Marinobacter sp.]MCL1485418.1 hypothetical protein [Marinobacter sp.]MCL1487950.1 hypothetical protein [Marinobacter sp.]UQG56141.1 hypothetical protein MIH16_00235 [Marinobacter sp. M4C]